MNLEDKTKFYHAIVKRMSKLFSKCNSVKFINKRHAFRVIFRDDDNHKRCGFICNDFTHFIDLGNDDEVTQDQVVDILLQASRKSNISIITNDIGTWDGSYVILHKDEPIESLLIENDLDIK